MRFLLSIAALALMAAAPAAWSTKPHAGHTASPAEIQLGRSLFFETRLSSNDKVSCATCHRPDRGFADGLRFSVGVSGTPLKRHTPHLYNLAWNHTFFWDGRTSSLEDQAVMPILHHDEMGMPGDTAAEKLRGIAAYAATFSEVYPKSGVTMGNIARSLAAFERTIVTRDSPADRYSAGDTAALDERAVRGRTLFFGRARCSTCHGGPNFTDDRFHNTGIGFRDGSNAANPDDGRYAITHDERDRAAFDRVGEFQMRPYPFFQMRRAFKTPSLRNVALTAPYQHDGSEATLLEVVTFYSKGGRDPQSYGKALDIRPLHFTEPDLQDLVAFLEGLTGVTDVQ
jgi:cytochrome c peroxidase